MVTDKSLTTFLIRIGYFLLIGLVAGTFIYSIHLLSMPLLVSLLLSFLLQPVVNFFENRGFNRIVIITSIYVITVFMSAVFLFLLIPIVTVEIQHFSENMPLYEKMIRDALYSLRFMIIERFPDVQIPDLYEYIKTVLFKGNPATTDAFGKYASSVMSVVSMIILIPVITFFFLVDGHLIKKAFLKMVPNRYFEMAILLVHKVSVAAQSFIRGQMIDAFAVGLMTSTGLAIIGMPFFLVIGIIAGMGNLIPYLGPIIGFIPAFCVLMLSPDGLTGIALVKVIIVFVAVQFIEGTFVYPIAVGKSVDMHPLTVIVGITVGSQIGGIVGMLLVIPVIAITKVTVEVLYFYLKRYSIL